MYMSDQGVFLSKLPHNWRIILTKEQLGHSYIFWTMPILIFCQFANFGNQSLLWFLWRICMTIGKLMHFNTILKSIPVIISKIWKYGTLFLSTLECLIGQHTMTQWQLKTNRNIQIYITERHIFEFCLW